MREKRVILKAFLFIFFLIFADKIYALKSCNVPPFIGQFKPLIF